MRVVYVNADAGVPVGGFKGCSIHVQEILRALLKRGAKIELLASRAGRGLPADLSAIRIHQLTGFGKQSPAEGERFGARIEAANSRLRDMVRTLDLPTDGPVSLLYERYSLWSCGAVAVADDLGIPSVLEVNAPLLEEQRRYREEVDMTLAEQVTTQAFERARVLVAVSEEIGAYLSRHPAASGKVRVIPNGVNPDRFSASAKPRLISPNGSFTIGFVGSLKPWHGVNVLVSAFAILRERCPEARLLIVGEGPERRRTEASLSEHRLLEAAHFTGSVPPEEVPALLAAMDVAVAPYPELDDFYFSPLKLYEYMAAGLPIVASRIGQIHKVIDHGVNGWLVPPGDAKRLAAALAELCNHREWRARLGQTARAGALQNHTWDSRLEQIISLAGLSDSVSATELQRKLS